jgi:hypothetical protein
MALNLSSLTDQSRGRQGEDIKVTQVPLDVHEYPVAPEGLTLQQVHVFVRHGEFCLIFHLSEFKGHKELFWRH